MRPEVEVARTGSAAGIAEGGAGGVAGAMDVATGVIGPLSRVLRVL
jgi:hypothetical protein